MSNFGTSLERIATQATTYTVNGVPVVTYACMAITAVLIGTMYFFDEADDSIKNEYNRKKADKYDEVEEEDDAAELEEEEEEEERQKQEDEKEIDNTDGIKQGGGSKKKKKKTKKKTKKSKPKRKLSKRKIHSRT